jgi:ribosome-associated protein
LRPRRKKSLKKNNHQHSDTMTEFELNTDYIELIRLLKLLRLVESGGQAKLAVEEGLVTVNGQTEFRKRAKLRKGDKIQFDSLQILIK